MVSLYVITLQVATERAGCGQFTRGYNTATQHSPNDSLQHTRLLKQLIQNKQSRAPGHTRQQVKTTGLSAVRQPKAPDKRPVDPTKLTAWIKSATAFSQLKLLLDRHGDQMNQIHVCAMLSIVIKLCGQPSANTRQSSSKNQRKDTRHADATVAGMPAAPATDGASGDLSQAHEVLQQLSAKLQKQKSLCRPWDLSLAAWACAKVC